MKMVWLGDSLAIINRLKGTAMISVGKAMDEHLAAIHAFTVDGGVVNTPMRLQAGRRGESSRQLMKLVTEALEELRKVPERMVTGTWVYSGMTYTLENFNKEFLKAVGKEHAFRGFVSSSLRQETAEAFVNLSARNTARRAVEFNPDNMIGLVRRITTKAGVYIDDLSDWGKNLGPKLHADRIPAVQVQEEVLMDAGYFQQVSDPMPAMEEGAHKAINGIRLYYVDFVEMVKPLMK